jgi:hypothetical protein
MEANRTAHEQGKESRNNNGSERETTQLLLYVYPSFFQLNSSHLLSKFGNVSIKKVKSKSKSKSNQKINSNVNYPSANYSRFSTVAKQVAVPINEDKNIS